MLKKAFIIINFLFLTLLILGCTKVVISSISVSGGYKTNYLLNEEFDRTYLVVTLKTGETSKEVTDYTIANFNSSIVGPVTVTVHYLFDSKDLTANFTVNILSSIQGVTELKIYDMPDILQSSARYDISVDQSPLFVYETLVNHLRNFAWVEPTTYTSVASFDFMGIVHVVITVKDGFNVTKATIHPLAYDIVPTITDNKIEFDLSYPANYTIELNEPAVNSRRDDSEIQEAIHLFANPIEENPITKEEADLDENIIYIEPGVWKTDTIPLKSNQTVYIAGGALLFGQFNLYGLENITIRGRGIISGSIYPRTVASERAIPVEIQKSHDITIEGLSFLDPAGWTVLVYDSENVSIDNIKIITARPNGDGITIQSSRNVVVRNSFVRTWDDSLVVKNMNGISTKGISFYNCSIWTDLAQSLEVGYECYGATMEDILFENITILHSYHKASMSIHNADQAAISNVIFRNITIEDANSVGDAPNTSDDNITIDLLVSYATEWSKSENIRGNIDNVKFENIKVLRSRSDLHIRLTGFDASHDIDGVVFQDVMFNNSLLSDANSLNLNSSVKNISIISNGTPTGAPVYRYYELNLTSNAVYKNIIAATPQEAIYVPSFAINSANPPYAGQTVIGEKTVRATHGTGPTAWGKEQTANYELPNHPVSNLLVDDESYWQAPIWSEDEPTTNFVTISFEFTQAHQIGALRLFGLLDSKYFIMQHLLVYSASLNTKNELVWSKKLNGMNYEFSSAKNNYLDLLIQPGEYMGIQIRIQNMKGVIYPESPLLRYVEFYPASLAFGKTPYCNLYEDVYNPEKLTDGDPTTYFESKKDVWPGWIVVDLGDSYSVRIINLHIPPLSSWPDRTQTIEIRYSISAEKKLDSPGWISLILPTEYLFSAENGKMVSIILPNAVVMQSIILIVTSNDAPGGYGAQFSEISVYS